MILGDFRSQKRMSVLAIARRYELGHPGFLSGIVHLALNGYSWRSRGEDQAERGAIWRRVFFGAAGVTPPPRSPSEGFPYLRARRSGESA